MYGDAAFLSAGHPYEALQLIQEILLLENKFLACQAVTLAY